jgi:uncharacterized membrane protein
MFSHHLKIVLLATLLIISTLSNTALFISLLLSTIFVPGYLIVERYFRDVSGKLALYILMSVLVSTQLIFLLSLLMGYSLATLKISVFMLLLPALLAKRPEITRKEVVEGAVFLILFLFSFALLYHSLWYDKGDYIVLTGSNWQDTPYHYEIVESINNGNFPPQEPSFAGRPLRYHYFVDLHTAILEKPLGYQPRLMLYLNSLFFPLFFLSVYALTLKVSSRTAALYSGIIAVFGWGFTYLWLFDAILSGTFDPKQSYVMDYDGLLNLPPILDNLLQQRPLLVGLPGLVFAIYFFISGYEEKKRNHILLSGIITGLLLPFHVLSTFSILVFIAIYLSAFVGLHDLKKELRLLLPFAVFVLLFIPHLGFLSSGAEFKKPWVIEYVRGNFVLHYLANLGLPLIMALAAMVVKVERWKLMALWMTVMLLFSFLPSFTPNPWDMYKFFLIAWIPLSVLSGQFLATIRRFRIVIPVLLVLSTLSTLNVVLWNLTDYGAASKDELQAGMWVRENTPEKAVFLTWPSIHSPPTMIGGRLRVLGYANWAYGHGVKVDKIWERVEDVKAAFNNPDDMDRVLEKYGVDYVYVGIEEIYNSRILNVVRNSTRLQLVYKEGWIRIYEVIR